MTVASETSRNDYNGNAATTVFAYTFRILDEEHIAVYVDGELQTLTSDYTVSGVGVDSGGNITFLVAPPSGAGNVVFARSIPVTQDTDYVENDPFPAEVHEEALDKLTMIVQQQGEEISRALRFSITQGTIDAELPPPVANNLLGWNSDADAIVNFEGTTDTPVSAFMATVLDDVDAAAARATLGAEASGNLPAIQEFRLTLTSGTPVTTGDVTGATTIYCTPYKGNHIALYNGSTWVVYTSAEFSLALGTLTASLPHDVFCYANSGVPALEFTAWTSTTTRATALVYQDGVLVKSGTTTRRYLGTFYTTSTTATEDSASKRFLFNYYNQVPCLAQSPLETTNSWTYTTATFRQANNNTANKFEFVVGVAENEVKATVLGSAQNSSVGVSMVQGVALDSTTALAANNIGGLATSNVASQPIQLLSMYSGVPSVGYHYIAWVEYSAATGTTTFFGDSNAPTLYQAGLKGSMYK